MDSLASLYLNAETMASGGGVKGTIVVVTSGKGGVGKTTSSASIGTALASLGDTVVLIDFDIGLRKLDLILGVERNITADIIDVIEGTATLDQALVTSRTSPLLKLLPASQIKDKSSLTEEGVSTIVQALATRFKWVICDSPAGIESGARLAMQEADIALVIVNPELSSIRDSDRMIGLLETASPRRTNKKDLKNHLIVTRYNERRAAKNGMLNTRNIEEILGMTILGIVPESDDILAASNVGRPVTANNPNSSAAKSYMAIAHHLRGDPIKAKPPSLFNRLFRK